MNSRAPHDSNLFRSIWNLFNFPTGFVLRSPWLFNFTLSVFKNVRERLLTGTLFNTLANRYLRFIPPSNLAYRVPLKNTLGHPIILKSMDLTPDERKQNNRHMSTLFFNSRFKFKDLLNLEYERDGDKNPKFGATIRANAAKLGIDPEKIKTAKVQHETVIDNAFGKDHILLEETIFSSTDDALEERTALQRYVRAILCMRASEEDTDKIIHSDIDDEVKRYAQRISEKKVSSYQGEVTSFLRWHKIHESLRMAKAPGDGDCFYHSIMLDIIHDALSNQLTDASPTAQQIKTRLIPHLNAQLIAHGKNAIDVTDKSLKQIMITLLESAPLLESPVTRTESDSDEVYSVKQCNIYHLLRDICAPALRELMQADLANLVTSDAVRTVLLDEFSCFIIKHYGDKLNFSEEEINIAKMQAENSELSDFPENRKQFFINAWHEMGKRLAKLADPAKNNSEMMNASFTLWWESNVNAIVTDYFSLHKTSRVMASRPQQIAMSQQLHCNLVNVNNQSGLLDPLTPAIQHAHTFMLRNTSIHFDAMIGDAHLSDPTQLTSELHFKMHDINLRHDEFKQSTYPWPKKVNDENELIRINQHNLSRTIDETLALIIDAESNRGDIFTCLNPQSQEILSVARLGYKDLLPHTLFGSGNASSQQEADDLLLAIKLQNDEIANYIQSKASPSN